MFCWLTSVRINRLEHCGDHHRGNACPTDVILDDLQLLRRQSGGLVVFKKVGIVAPDELVPGWLCPIRRRAVISAHGHSDHASQRELWRLAFFGCHGGNVVDQRTSLTIVKHLRHVDDWQ